MTASGRTAHRHPLTAMGRSFQAKSTPSNTGTKQIGTLSLDRQGGLPRSSTWLRLDENKRQSRTVKKIRRVGSGWETEQALPHRCLALHRLKLSYLVAPQMRI